MRCFGYGSLVHRETRPGRCGAERASIRGFERAWAHRTERSGTVLTVRRAPGRGIEGVFFAVDDATAAALDRREVRYDRLSLDAPGDYTYAAPEAILSPGTREHPILRSYLDCVLAGYHDLGGADAVAAFVDTTTGWETPILDDRSEPRYVRAVAVAPAVLAAIDDELRCRGILERLFSGGPSPRG